VDRAPWTWLGLLVQRRRAGRCLRTAVCRDELAAATSGLRLGLSPRAVRSVLYVLISVCERLLKAAACSAAALVPLSLLLVMLGARWVVRLPRALRGGGCLRGWRGWSGLGAQRGRATRTHHAPAPWAPAPRSPAPAPRPGEGNLFVILPLAERL